MSDNDKAVIVSSPTEDLPAVLELPRLAPWQDAADTAPFITTAGPEETFEALTSAEPFADHIGEVMYLRDVIAHYATVTDKETQKPRPAVRVILSGANKDGEPMAIAAISMGLLQSVETLYVLFGRPPYSPARPVKLIQKATKAGRRTFVLGYVKP